MTPTTDPALEALRLKTVVWVVSLATVGLIFDGYDLVVYGTVVSTFLRDPSHIGIVTPAVAGALGSYALVGVLVGALLAGSVGDILGRRKVMLFSYAWFSVGMAITALTSTTTMFGDHAVHHRPRCRRAGGHHRGARIGVRPERQEEPVQRHHLLGSAAGQPDGRHARHRAAGAHRLARHVPHRRATSVHLAAARLFQHARVRRLAGCARPARRGPGDLRADGCRDTGGRARRGAARLLR